VPAEPAIVFSVIVPMFREARRIAETLADLTSTLETWPTACEVLLINDGSDDDTLRVVAPFVTDFARGSLRTVRLISYDTNKGKGFAVRAGLAAAVGKWRLIMDADNACRVCEASKLLEAATASPAPALVAGSRRTKDAHVVADPKRKLAGSLFRLALTPFGLNLLRDTQCGFKLYRADLAGLIARESRENGFAFDLEHLLIANAAKLPIREVGVAWQHKDGGTVRPVRDGLRMLRQAARLRLRFLTNPPNLAMPSTSPPSTSPTSEVEVKTQQPVPAN
jgi:dolichyl-phosphate beta-glucosyltransferase